MLDDTLLSYFDDAQDWWDDPSNDQEEPASEADHAFLDEARKVWDRPEVQRVLQRLKRGEPLYPEDEGPSHD